jgi:hypothetical protein
MRPENTTSVLRRRPRVAKSDKLFWQVVDIIWGELAWKNLNLPTAAVEYNLFMGGVDMSDQRRAQYCTQLRAVCAWFPLFFWLLDTTLINVFLIAQQHVGGAKGTLYTNQWKFQNEVAWGPIEEGFAAMEEACQEAQRVRAMAKEGEDQHVANVFVEAEVNESQQPDTTPVAQGIVRGPKGCFRKGTQPAGNSAESRKRGCWSKNRSLPMVPFDKAEHKFQTGSLKNCNYCRWLKQQATQFPGSVESNQFLTHLNGPCGKPRRTKFTCSHCTISGEGVALCKDMCFRMWHEHQITTS